MVTNPGRSLLNGLLGRKGNERKGKERRGKERKGTGRERGEGNIITLMAISHFT